MIDKKMIAFCGTYCGVCGRIKSGVRAVKPIEELCFGASAIKRNAVWKRGLNIAENAQICPVKSSKTCLMIQSMAIMEQGFAT